VLSGGFGYAATATLIVGGLVKAPLPSIIAFGVIVLGFFVLAFFLALREKGRAFVKCRSFEFRIDPYDKSNGGSS